ncbi:MAG: hypothetical protein WCC60_20920, partial [Ilumatobacteraceae bacterium]
MTMTATLERSQPVATRRRARATRATRVARADLPPLSARLQLVRAALVLLLVMTATLVLQLVLISSLQQTAAQGRAFDDFRSQLARGVAPIGPTDADGKLLASGTAVAFIEIPSIGLHQVVGEGTSSGALFDGPG